MGIMMTSERRVQDGSFVIKLLNEWDSLNQRHFDLGGTYRDFTSYVTRYGSLAGSACVRVAVCLRDLCTNGCVERDGGCVTFLQSVMIGYISTNDLLLLAINMTKQHELS